MPEKPRETGAQLEARWLRGTGGDWLSLPTPNDVDRAFIKCAHDLSTFLEGLRELSAEIHDKAIIATLGFEDVVDPKLFAFAEKLDCLLGERVTEGSGK